MTNFDVNNSKWLDPPDPPTHWECNICGSIFDGGDLNETPRGSDNWLCDDCLEEHNAKKMAKCFACGEKGEIEQMTPCLNGWICADCMDKYFPVFKEKR